MQYLRKRRKSFTENQDLLKKRRKNEMSSRERPMLKDKSDSRGDNLNRSCDCSKHFQENEAKLMLEVLQGFVILINKKGKVLYVSETVEEHMGLSQVEMIGKTILDFIHPHDTEELAKQFVMKLPKMFGPEPIDVDADEEGILNHFGKSSQKRTFFTRMKYHRQKNGMRRKQSGYTLLKWTGQLKLVPKKKRPGYRVDNLIAMCHPLQTHSILEIPTTGNMFMSRHELDLKFTFCDPRIISLTGFEPEELIGKTLYYFHNPSDAEKVRSCHSTLISKGKSVCKYYRFCSKNCNWIWMQTQATLIYNTKNEPQYIVCMNSVISEDEGQKYLMMEQQEDFIDTSFQGCIDLGNTTQISPSSTNSSCLDHRQDDTGYNSSSASSCCTDQRYDDTGYNSSCSITSPTTSPFTSSPDDHPMDSGDDIDLKTDHDVTIAVMKLSSIFQKDVTDCYAPDPLPANSVLSPDSSDPFLFQTRGLSGVDSGDAEDDIDLLDDLLRRIEECENLNPKNISEESVNSSQTLAPDHAYTSVWGGEKSAKQSLLRSLLDKSMAANQSSHKPSFLADSTEPTVNDTVLSSASQTVSNMSVGMNTVLQTSVASEGSAALPTNIQSISSTSLLPVPIEVLNPDDNSSRPSPQSEPYIPDDLLDFAMQYCDTLTDEQAQTVMSDVGPDIWGEDEFITFMPDVTPPQCESVVSTIATSSNALDISYIDLDEERVTTHQSVLPTFQTARASNSGQSAEHSTMARDHEHSTRVNRKNPQTILQPSSSSEHIFRKPVCPVQQGKRQNGMSLHRGHLPGKPGPSQNYHSNVVLSCHGNSRRLSHHSGHSSHFSSKAADSNGMSELEKYLRGFVRPNRSKHHEITFSETVSELSISGNPKPSTPFLQKLLTGELSHELYQEIDKQMLLKEKESQSQSEESCNLE